MWTGSAVRPQPWRLEVNDPLRLHGANVYLLGHGYAPILRYTDRYGGQPDHGRARSCPRTSMLTSTGVVKFPDANVDPTGKTQPRRQRPGRLRRGLPADHAGQRPTARCRSSRPSATRGCVLTAYEGNLGLDSGFPQSVYTLDQRQIATGQLQAGRPRARRCKPGETWTLPDGSTVQFVGTQQWITVSVRLRPGREDRAGRRGGAAGRPDGVAVRPAPAGLGPRRPGRRRA